MRNFHGTTFEISDSMNQSELLEKIGELEKKEFVIKNKLEDGFEQLKNDLKPSHIALHAAQSVTGKIKSGLKNLFKKKSRKI